MKPLFLGYDARGKAIRIKPDDRRIHMHVLGSSGSGKSRFLEWMIRGDLKNRQGFCLVDPHGELYDAVVAYAARYALDRDIILLNLSEPDTVVGFNPFRQSKDTDVSVQVDRRITATMHAWGVENADETPTLARTLRLIYTVMMEQGVGLPQAEHLLNFSAKDVRSFLIDRLQSPLIRREWMELHDLKPKDFRDEILSAKNRLFKLLTSSALRRFMGLTGFSIDLRDVMDQGKVLLVNLKQSKHLSHEAARTFGALLVNEFFESALQRQTSPGRDPKPFYLYLDVYGKGSSSGSSHGSTFASGSASFAGTMSGQSFYTPDNWFSSPIGGITASDALSSGSTNSNSSGYSDSESYSSSESEADIPIFFPTPFEELSSVQYYSLDEQLTELTAALKQQFQRHCFIQIRQQETQPMLVPFVEPVTTFTYNRNMLDFYVKRQHETPYQPLKLIACWITRKLLY